MPPSSDLPCPTDPAPHARRERRKDARPRELLEAALELFVQKGFAATKAEEVAKLAGVPAAVVNHARHALSALEQQQTDARAQVDLFAPPPDLPAAEASLLEKSLSALDPDTLSPREALDALYQLKKLVNKA